MIDLKEGNKEANYKLSEYPETYELKGYHDESNDFKIFIEEQTLVNIENFLSSDIHNEMGGVLVGDVCINSENKKFILIENFIIAKHTNSSLSRLTFTHETWTYINENLEKNFPNKKILGWYHSHPGHTVFLSNFDIFIQENFFNMDYMVAYVFDPTIRDRGFYFWDNSKILKSKGFYVYGDKKKEEFEKFDEIKNNLNSFKNKFFDISQKEILGSNFKKNIILAILLLNLLLLIIVVYNYYDLNKKIILREDYNKDLAEIKSNTRMIKEELDNLTLDNEIKRNYVQPADTIKITYTVKNGDTLEKIASQFYNSKKGTDIIVKQNNLQSKWDIKPGQILEIPNMSETIE